MQNALLCTGYGAVDPRPRADRAAVEAALQKAAPGWVFARAVTSPVMRARMAQNGLPADSVAQALEKLAAAGCRAVVVQPTNLLYGQDYEALCAEAAAHAGQFEGLRVGEPLLACNADLVAAARAVAAACPPQPGETLLLAGHGTDRFAGVVYPALQGVFALQGRQDVLVAALHGWPALDDVLPALHAAGDRRVHLMPFLLGPAHTPAATWRGQALPAGKAGCGRPGLRCAARCGGWAVCRASSSCTAKNSNRPPGGCEPRAPRRGRFLYL